MSNHIWSGFTPVEQRDPIKLLQRSTHHLLNGALMGHWFFNNRTTEFQARLLAVQYLNDCLGLCIKEKLSL